MSESNAPTGLWSRLVIAVVLIALLLGTPAHSGESARLAQNGKLAFAAVLNGLQLYSMAPETAAVRRCASRPGDSRAETRPQGSPRAGLTSRSATATTRSTSPTLTARIPNGSRKTPNLTSGPLGRQTRVALPSNPMKATLGSTTSPLSAPTGPVSPGGPLFQGLTHRPGLPMALGLRSPRCVAGST